MYTKYVEVMAKHATDIFKEMTGTEVLAHRVKRDERAGDTTQLAHTISYEHMDKPVKGQFVLGFVSEPIAIAVASALAEKVGLPPLTELDVVATDLLNEFMNTIVGRTISDWDRMGMPVRFSTPSSIKFSNVKIEMALDAQAYMVILSLTFSHIIFRLTFQEGDQGIPKGKRILVVEDSAVIRNIIAQTLEKNHIEVQQAENGRRAAEIYKDFHPHLVLMDLVMPEMGGFEAMESIRQYDPNASFIVLTSSSRRDEVLTAKKIGVRAYLIKPFKSALLLREVKKFFNCQPQ